MGEQFSQVIQNHRFGSGGIIRVGNASTFLLDRAVIDNGTIVVLDVVGAVTAARTQNTRTVSLFAHGVTCAWSGSRFEVRGHVSAAVDVGGAIDVLVAIDDFVFTNCHLLIVDMRFTRPSPSNPSLLSGSVVLRNVAVTRTVLSPALVPAPFGTGSEFVFGTSNLALGRFDVADSAFSVNVTATCAAVLHRGAMTLGNSSNANLLQAAAAGPTAVWQWINVSFVAVSDSTGEATAQHFLGDATLALSGPRSQFVTTNCTFVAIGLGITQATGVRFERYAITLSGPDSQLVLQSSVIRAHAANRRPAGGVVFYIVVFSVAAPGARWAMLDIYMSLVGDGLPSSVCVFFARGTFSASVGGAWVWSNVDCSFPHGAPGLAAAGGSQHNDAYFPFPAGATFATRCLRADGTSLALPNTTLPRPLPLVTAVTPCRQCNALMDCAPGRATGIKDYATCACNCTDAALAEGVPLDASCAAAVRAPPVLFPFPRLGHTRTHTRTSSSSVTASSLTPSLSLAADRDPSTLTASATTRSPSVRSATSSSSVALSATVTPHPQTLNPRTPAPLMITDDGPDNRDANVSAAATALSTTSASTAAVVSAIAGGGGGGGMAELQSLALLGRMRCSDATVRNVAGSATRILSPLRLADSAGGRLGGSAVLSVAAMFLQFLCVALMHFVVRKGVSPWFTASFARYHFPSVALRVFGALYQGMCADAAQMAVATACGGSASSAERVVGIVSLVLLAAVPMAAAWWFAARCVVSYAPYAFAFEGVPLPLRRLLLPRGFWWTHGDPQAKWTVFYGGLWAPPVVGKQSPGVQGPAPDFSQRRPWLRFAFSLVGLPFTQQWLLALLVSVELPCGTQAALLCALFSAGVLATFLLSPLRQRFALLVRGVLQVVLLLIALIRLIPALRAVAEELALVLSGVGLLATVTVPLLSLAERFSWWKREARMVAQRSIAAGTVGEPLLSPLSLPQAEDTTAVPPLGMSFCMLPLPLRFGAGANLDGDDRDDRGMETVDDGSAVSDEEMQEMPAVDIRSPRSGGSSPLTALRPRSMTAPAFGHVV